MPIETAVSNESSQEKELILKQELPYGVEGFDYDPEPQGGDETQWELTIPTSSSKVISSWLKLPDQVNTFDIKMQLYEKEKLLGEEILTLEVTHTVLSFINELILELEVIDAQGQDRLYIREAIRNLEQIRSRPTGSLMNHLLNLRDAVQAAGYLGEVKQIDLAIQRNECQEIMVVMGRRFFEAVKNIGEDVLNPLLKIIEKEVP